MGKYVKYLIIALLMSCCWMVVGQSISSLREDIRKAEEEIRISNQLIGKTRKDQQLSQSQLKMIRSRIRNRQDIIKSLEKEMSLVSNDIDLRTNSLTRLNAQMATLHREYSEMLRTAYKNYKLNNFLLFLFASDDFNDATGRIAFMHRYNQMREKKGAEINALSNDIGIEIKSLDEQRDELNKTRSVHGTELKSLGSDESQYKNSVKELSNKEKKLTREIKSKQELINKAQKQIENIIAQEAKKNKNEKRTAAEDKHITELSGRFDQNKGKLPYPIRGGVIIDRYGLHPHPIYEGLKIDNKGVNIAGQAGADVGCVFDGNVTKVFSLPGLNNCIMVRHGNYITLYANLASVSVKVGDKVSINQRLGRIANNDDNFLHFEIWKETVNLNPEQWLNR